MTHICMCMDSGISETKVPEGVVGAGRLRHGVVRLGLHRMNDVREFHRILDEEHRDVVAHQVPIAFVGIELHGEAAHVASGVGRTALASNGGESNEHRRALVLSAKSEARVYLVSGS